MTDAELRAALGRALEAARVVAREVPAEARAGVGASVDVIAIGKGAGPMLDGVVEAWGSAVMAALAILPEGAPAPRDDARVRVMEAAHPVPDERSVEAGEAALALARKGSAETLIVLVSGGASALAWAPVAGVTLAEAQIVSRALLASGADVRAMNVVRRHLSRVGGGGLVRAAAPRRTVARVASDVIGGQAYDVGSGPAAFDPTTCANARAVLRAFVPAFASLPVAETLKPADAEAALVQASIVAEPATLAALLARELEALGLATRTLPPSSDDVDALAAEYARLAQSLAPGEALVRSAEPSVHVEVAGRGGRCTHLAALVAPDLPPDVVLLCAASDGVDGASDTAGALVRASSFPDREAVARAVHAFDTGPLHVSHGTALPRAPSGVNLADVHALVRV